MPETMKFFLQEAFAHLGHWWSMEAIESLSCPLILSYSFKHMLSSQNHWVPTRWSGTSPFGWN